MRPIVTSTLCAAALAASVGLAPAAFADVQPGDVITPANKEKVKGLVPEELYPYVIEDFEDLEMKIAPTGDYPAHPKYVEATVKYACQPSLDENGMLQDYVAGEPFPYSEWAKEATNHACDLTPDDPQFALKLAWNVNYRWQGGSGLNLPHWAFSNMRNRGKETWRIMQGEYRRTYFSHRADLLPETHQLEEGTNIEWAEFFDVKTPFDLRGTMFLLYRYEDGSDDDTWAYIPALRRVRRISATQKSDSLLGTEFSLEDFYIFSGYVWAQEWEFKGESTKLGPMNTPRNCFPNVMGDFKKQIVHFEGDLGSEEQVKHCSWGPYGALPYDGTTWEKRTVFQLDDIPKQKGHPYSRKKIWYDKETYMPIYSIMYDRSGKPYKSVHSVFKWSEDNTYNPGNRDKNVLNYSHIMIVNLQNEISHTSQFDNANAAKLSVDLAKDYYDTTKLKRRGR